MKDHFYDRIFFTNVRRILTEREMSNNELHHLSGVSGSVISDITTGKGNPTLDTMAAIAMALNESLPSMLTIQDTSVYQDMMDAGGVYTTPKLPAGFEYIGVILPEHKLPIVLQWDKDARKNLQRVARQDKNKK
jgi:transcriptional regulator with XRE-family HTH domain